VKEDFAGLDMR